MMMTREECDGGGWEREHKMPDAQPKVKAATGPHKKNGGKWQTLNLPTESGAVSAYEHSAAA